MFTTHAGLYHYNRLNFGVKVASEIFQKTLKSTERRFESKGPLWWYSSQERPRDTWQEQHWFCKNLKQKWIKINASFQSESSPSLAILLEKKESHLIPHPLKSRQLSIINRDPWRSSLIPSTSLDSARTMLPSVNPFNSSQRRMYSGNELMFSNMFCSRDSKALQLNI